MGASQSCRLAHRHGYYLHEQVPATHWCITRADLKILRKRVRHGVDQGMITPTVLDPFDPSDNAIGPNIHTHRQQAIGNNLNSLFEKE